MNESDNPARILVVEDSRTQAEQLRFILESANYEVSVAASGEQALEMMSDTRFDMVISDIVMPGISGYELCRQIKSRPQSSDIPVVLLTTRRDPTDIFQGLECGADNFHTKPYDPEHILERIRYILYNRTLKIEGKLKVGLQVAFFGKIFTINSEKEQILDLLISAFEDTVTANRMLELNREELAEANRKVEEYARILEGRIQGSEERHTAIVNAISEGIITIDRNGLLESVNPAVEKIFGYRATDLIGQSTTRLLASGSHEYFRSCLTNGGCNGIVGAQCHLQGQRQDGSTFPLSMLINEISIGEAQAYVLVTRDLTAENRAEKELRQAQKMESVGHLTGGIAHDFNNLLTVVLGNSAQLLEELQDQPEQQNLVRMTLNAAQRAAELTQRLLAFSRKQALDPQSVDINNLIAGMTGLLGRSLGAGVETRFVGAENLWPAMVDANQLENTLLNLGINARDAMTDGGMLTIETANITLDGNYPAADGEAVSGDYVMLSVSDTGTGIPESVLSRVFEPFFTTKAVGKGSGLGLPMVYGFVKQSGGHIRIYSEENRGTSVKIYLPRARMATVSQEKQAQQQVRGGTEKILLVEDDELVRDFASDLVRRLGYQVVTAVSGPDALNKLGEHDDLDLLFTDVVMPGGMTGLELAHAVRQQRPGIPVLFTSGFAEQAAVRGQHQLDGEFLISKPYRKDDLALKIREALQK